MTKKSKGEPWKKPHPPAKLPRYARGEVQRLADDPSRPAHVTRSGGRPSARRAAVRAQRIQMAADVWRLLVQSGGMTSFEEIGRKLGVSKVTAWRYAIAYANRIQRETIGNATVMRTLQATRLEELLAAHWKHRGQKTSADVILRALERQARLLGLDKIPDNDIYTGAQMRIALQTMVALFQRLVDDVEKRRQFILGARRVLPSAVRGTAMEEPTAAEDLVVDADAIEAPDLGADPEVS